MYYLGVLFYYFDHVNIKWKTIFIYVYIYIGIHSHDTCGSVAANLPIKGLKANILEARISNIRQRVNGDAEDIEHLCLSDYNCINGNLREKRRKDIRKTTRKQESNYQFFFSSRSQETYLTHCEEVQRPASTVRAPLSLQRDQDDPSIVKRTPGS